MECEMIKLAVAKTSSTRKAGKLLGIDHSNVIRKAKRYGIDLRTVASQTHGKEGNK